MLGQIPVAEQSSSNNCATVQQRWILADSLGGRLQRRLRQLDLSGCGRLAAISGLGTCSQLRKADFSGCANLVDISGLAGCTALEEPRLCRGPGVGR